MLGPARHIADLARFRANRAARQRDDAQSLTELEAGVLALPPGLQVDWLGVAGYRITYEGRSLLLDPYLTRVPFRTLALRRPALPDEATIGRFIDPAEEVVGIAVGHTHWDHALDAPALARRHGCPALGSSSMANLMRLHGLGELAVEVEPHRVYELGPFEVSFTPSVHSKLVLGLAVPFDGELTCDHLDGLCPTAYRCGQVFGIHIEVDGFTLYHQGSADLIDDEIRHSGVDVMLAGIAGRSFTKGYWERILPRLQPRTIVPSHYDDFFVPLDADIAFTTNVDVSGFPQEVAAVSGDFAVAALPRVDGARPPS